MSASAGAPACSGRRTTAGVPSAMPATTAEKHPSLAREPANLIGGKWIPIPGETIASRNPARPDRVVWRGASSPQAAHEAIAAARDALPAWSSMSFDRRAEALRSFQKLAKDRADAFAEILCDETGKALWECKAEAGLLSAKVDITLETGEFSGRHRVTDFSFPMGETKRAACYFRPHGVMACLGPFNFPGHLPNGHIVPALAMGNTVVFKPSDKTPGVGQFLAELYAEALDSVGAPPGVVNLVQGGVDVASAVIASPDIDGVLFTGSWPVGRKILEASLDYPGRMVALELGGNNPAVVLPDADLRQAAIEIVRCAFITTGQRCTCTRRLIVHEAVADRLIPAIVEAASRLVVGDPRSAEPVFMGPIINEASQQAVFRFERRLAEAGGRVLLGSRPLEGREGWYVTPSIVEVDRFVNRPGDDPEGFHPGCDEEIFGPLLRIARVSDLDGAIDQANRTRYGLAASIFTRDEQAQRRFLAECRAGCVNVNTGTAGASSKLPFGGLGNSGNHRPAGAFSLDYCAFPTANMTELGADAQIAQGMTFDDAWLA